MRPNTHGNLFYVEEVEGGVRVSRREIAVVAKTYKEAMTEVEAEEKRRGIKGIVRPEPVEEEQEVPIEEEAKELETGIEEGGIA